jgi:hypothetical protein
MLGRGRNFRSWPISPMASPSGRRRSITTGRIHARVMAALASSRDVTRSAPPRALSSVARSRGPS